MIYLVHGENQIDSRRFFSRLKSSYQHTFLLPKKPKKELLDKQSREVGNLLFGGKTAFLVEDFSGDWGFLPEGFPAELDILLWAASKIKEVPSQVKSHVFNSFKKISVFKFADAVLLKREKEAQIIINSLLQSKEPSEKIFAAMVRNFCLMYSYKEEKLDKKIPPFVLDRLGETAKFWSKTNLKKALVVILNADLSLKQGRKPEVVFSFLVGQLTSL